MHLFRSSMLHTLQCLSLIHIYILLVPDDGVHLRKDPCQIILAGATSFTLEMGIRDRITGAHHYKCDVLVSQEAFGKRIAEDKIKVAWLQQGSCLIYAKTIQRQGVFTAEDGNILFFLRKIVSNDLEIKMEACMRAIHEMLSFVQNISSNS